MPHQTQLQEIRIKLLYSCGRARRPASSTRAARLRDLFARRASVQPVADPHCQLTGVVHLLSAARGVERRVDFGEIPDMRPVQDRGAELGRLDRILSAMLDHRAADEHDRCEPENKPSSPIVSAT